METPLEVRLPQDLDQLQYEDLSNLIEHQDSSNHPEYSGGYADVFVGYLTKDKNKESKLKVAIKVLRAQKDIDNVNKIKTYLIRETVVWQKLKHENILEFLGLASEFGRSGCPALISPYCNKGTVNDHLKRNPDLGTRFFMIKGVAEGLQYLHLNGIVHGDLKPSNILVHDDGHALLCDFGRSKILTQRGFTTKPAGACRYQAPEHLNEGTATKAIDVYAFAPTSYEIWTGLQPFHEILGDTKITIQIITKEARPKYPDSAPLGTDVIWELFEDCWRTKPEERPGILAVKRRLANMNIPTQ